MKEPGAVRARRLHGTERTLHVPRGSSWPWLLLLIATGCAGNLPQPADPVQTTRGILELGTVVPDSGWSARGKMDWLIDGRRGHGRVRMLLADSGRVRVDIQPQGAFGLGGSHAILWADREQVWWQEGSEPPRLVDADLIFAPILGGRATGEDLALLLLGLSQLGARWPPPPWETVADRDPALLARLPDGASERAAIAGPPLVLTRLERRSTQDEVQFRAKFSDFEPAPPLAAELARKLDLEAPGQRNKLQVRWEEIAQGAGTAVELDWPEAGLMQ